MLPSQFDFILHIADEVSYCFRKTSALSYEEFINDETLTRATIRSLEIIGEAAKNVQPTIKAKYPLVNRKRITGMSDEIIHNYFGVDYEIIWEIVKNDLPELQKWITLIIEKEQPN